MEEKIGKTIKADISKEMKVSYLNYAMSVIVSRALPDVRDGLKPVHRRILFDMNEMGLKASGGSKKSARIVGDVLGKYHPHGDASVYEALVRLAQDFSLRYPLVSPQGNFGSIDGDSAAAMRYTEAKMSRIGEAMLTDLEKETVDFGPNYDDSLQEPLVLPAGFPYLLCNGSSGIAVGMATNIAPHNLVEVSDGLCALIDNPDISISELMEYIKGPDFPTYGIIHGMKGIKDAYETGRGKVVVRGRYEIEEKKNKEVIVFTEIPYQVNKATLVAKINDLRKEVIKDIAEVRDESDREGIRVVIELKKNAVAEIVLNHLFKNTQLESNFNINALALVNSRPKLLNLKDMLYYYIKHREDVVTRRSQYNLKKALQREHILLGLKIGLENIDEIIAIIKKSDNNEMANNILCERFGLDHEQANAIIQMRLGKLSHLETNEILDELANLEGKIKYYRELLADKQMLLAVVKKEIKETSDNYGDRRRTEINPREVGGIIDKDFIKKEAVIVTISNKGFVRRVPATEYKTQNRGGTGVKGANLRDEDFVEHLFTASSHDRVLIVTSLGRAFWFEVYEIPESTKTGRGANIRSLLPKLELNENISTLINLKEFSEDLFILMATKRGVAKRVRLDAFVNARKNGIKAIILDEGDELLNSTLVREEDEAMIVSKKGKGLRFQVSGVRAMGRSTHGVRGMKLANDDEIIGLVKVDEDKRILMITDVGKGKQVEFNQFMVHNRGTQGQAIYRLGVNGNYLVSAKSVNNENDVVCITHNGIIIRTHVENISIQGRNASGVNMVRMKKDDDYIVAMAVTKYQEDEPEEEIIETEEKENTEETT